MNSETRPSPNNRFTRRAFLGTAAKAASAAAIGSSLFNARTALAAGPLVRRDVGGLATSDPILNSYRTAIAAMRALPAINPLSWDYQAAIHGTMATTNPQQAWNTCEHYTDFFWSWHRMYLYWFERIIRKMSGDNNWALPYWNWTLTTERTLPAPFRDTTSVLYTLNRDPAMNNGTGSLTSTQVDYTVGFSKTNFVTAYTQIESTPHDDVHVAVGGSSGWMSDPRQAAQDPIFWLHHSNIDRLWNLWLAQGGVRADPVTSAWRNTQFTFFNEHGSPVKMTGCDVLRASDFLKYAYENEGVQVKPPLCTRRIVPIHIFWATERILHIPIPEELTLGAEPVSFTFEIKSVRNQLVSINEDKSKTLQLELGGVVTDRQPGVMWEVYVSQPGKIEPNSESPSYVGNLSLFSAGIRSQAHHEFKPAHFVYSIGRALETALKGKEERLQVTLIPTGILINGKPSHPEVQSPVRIGEATLSVEMQKEK